VIVDLATTAGRALWRSRLLTPPGPRALLQIVHEVIRSGTNPYTLLAVAAARWPNRPAVVDDDGAVSYREVQARTDSLAGELVRHGVGPGQAVGILCRNGSRFVEAVFAAALVGADVVLLNTDFRTEALSAALSAHKIGRWSATTNSRIRSGPPTKV
jgi:acyl-CoA synthetase (AMP-forming)/AMP-acid ligase II